MCPSPLPIHLTDLDFSYPEDLVAKEPHGQPRVMISRPGDGPIESTKKELLQLVKSGDLFVINNTKVEKRRIFTCDDLEVLFVQAISGAGLGSGVSGDSAPGADGRQWQVLFPARKTKIGDRLEFPGGLTAELIEKGRPQTIRLSRPLEPGYFDRFGEMPLPPYIQEARKERHNRFEDDKWYQTAWAQIAGSQAAPTASLHFTNDDLNELSLRGVKVAALTLHVGLGTFLPIQGEDLDQHQMHVEQFSLSADFVRVLSEVKGRRGRVWALGTTSARALESYALGMGEQTESGGYHGWTDLFIRPGYEFSNVDVLLTNFHQPRSTLLALVAAFAGLERTMLAYQWAVSHKFRLFSYGDLSVWLKK